MKVSGEYLFDGPQPLVWDTLLDPDVLATVLPGCEKLERVGEDEYEGALKIKIGPIQGEFMGRVKLENIQPPDSYTMQVDGRGAPGFVKAAGTLSLEPADARTRVTYEGDAQVGGRLASVGQRLVESSAKAIIKQSLDGLNASVRARADATAAGARATESGAAATEVGGRTPAADAGATESGIGTPSPVTVKRPSQRQFAAAVAREVAADVIPAWARYAAVAVLIAVVALILYVLIT